MIKRLLAVFLVLVVITSFAFSAENYYQKGDSSFSFRVGPSFPDFAFFYNTNTTLAGGADMHLKTGGFASISYQGFISNNLSLGGELGYMFNYSIEKTILTMVPFSVKLSWIPVQTGKFDLAVSLGAGFNYLRYDEMRYFAPMVTATVSPSFFFTQNWGVGIEGGLFTIAEIYHQSSGSDKFESSNIAGFSPVSVCVTYRK